METGRTSRGKIRILIAHREGIFRLGLKKLFALEDDLRVVAEADKADEVLARVESFRPDVAFIQLDIMSEGNRDLPAAVTERASKCKIVATASSEAQEASTIHVSNGMAGVILKSVDPKKFVECARRVHRGETWFPKKQVSTPDQPPKARVDQPTRPVDTLTHREKSIISCLMEGWHNREIGTHLAISEQTVKNHLRAIYDKVGVSDRLELVLYAIHQRMELPGLEAGVPLH